MPYVDVIFFLSGVWAVFFPWDLPKSAFNGHTALDFIQISSGENLTVLFSRRKFTTKLMHWTFDTPVPKWISFMKLNRTENYHLKSYLVREFPNGWIFTKISSKTNGRNKDVNWIREYAGAKTLQLQRKFCENRCLYPSDITYRRRRIYRISWVAHNLLDEGRTRAYTHQKHHNATQLCVMGAGDRASDRVKAFKCWASHLCVRNVINFHRIMATKYIIYVRILTHVVCLDSRAMPRNAHKHTVMCRSSNSNNNRSNTRAHSDSCLLFYVRNYKSSSM